MRVSDIKLKIAISRRARIILAIFLVIGLVGSTFAYTYIHTKAIVSSSSKSTTVKTATPAKTTKVPSTNTATGTIFNFTPTPVVIPTPTKTSTPATITPKIYTNTNDVVVDSPNTDSTGAIAQCVDGLYSHSMTTTGSCSSHGGDRPWCSTIQDEYNNKVTAENNSYNEQLEAFEASQSEKGLFRSGMTIAGEQNLENQHEANIAAINSWDSSQVCWADM